MENKGNDNKPLSEQELHNKFTNSEISSMSVEENLTIIDKVVDTTEKKIDINGFDDDIYTKHGERIIFRKENEDGKITHVKIENKDDFFSVSEIIELIEKGARFYLLDNNHYIPLEIYMDEDFSEIIISNYHYDNGKNNINKNPLKSLPLTK